MTLPLFFRPVAEDEYDDASQWYERQQRGLGDDFEAEVWRVLEEVSSAPARHALAHRDIREAA